MEVYLIRHTTPAISRKGLIYGRTDVPLAASFSDELENILKQIPAELDAVYTSPSSRCVTLAGSISKIFFIEKSLYEMDFGDWEGKTWDTIDSKASEVWMNDFVNLAPPNGESMRGMSDRIMNFWDTLSRRGHQRIAIITHGGVIRIILAQLNFMDLKRAFEIKVGFAEVFKVSLSSCLPQSDLPA